MSNPTKHQLLLVGYAADAPEISATPSGTLVARLAIYTQHVYKRNGQEVVETDRHSVVAYGEKAHAAQHIRKGSLVEIHGWLKQESWPTASRDRCASPHASLPMMWRSRR